MSASSRHASRACCAAKTTCFSKPGSCSGVRVSLTAFTSAKALALRAASLQAHQSLLTRQLAFRSLHHHLMSRLHFRNLQVDPPGPAQFPQCQTVPAACPKFKFAVLAQITSSVAQSHRSCEPDEGVSFLALAPNVRLAGVVGFHGHL